MKNQLLSISMEGLLSPRVLDDSPCFLNDQTRAKNLGIFNEFAKKPGGFLNSGYRKIDKDLTKIKALAEQKRKSFSHLVVVGIGGSSLGTQTLISTLSWKIPKDKRNGVSFIDNLDPLLIAGIFEDLEPKKTLIAIVSKSGTTLETLAPLGQILAWIKSSGVKDPLENFVAITDPQSGPLRKWANEEGISSLEAPKEIGGRFSAFTPVCLFPAAFLGIDIDSIVEGAGSFFEDSNFVKELLNPLSARLFELEHAGFRAHYLWVYSSKLKEFAQWFVQLWGESLGKKNFSKDRVGLIPCPGVGATDQHSFLQRATEGRNDIVSGFIKIKNWPKSNTSLKTTAQLPMEFKVLDKIKGLDFGNLLNAEALATEKSLQELGRPTYSVTLNSLDESSIGALLAFYMDLTVINGIYLGLNPFDQPGVERGKKLFFEFL